MRATKRFLVAVAAGAVVAGGVATPVQAAGVPPPSGPAARPTPVVEEDGGGTGLWIVRLAGEPLATYTGGVRGLAPTSPRATRADRLDVAAAASVSYLDYLAGEQERFTAEAERSLGRELEVAHAYRNVVNGLALRISDAEAATLARLPQVVSVYEDEVHEPATDTSHDLIRSAEVWAGATGTGVATRGEGVVVGMLDSGVNPDHPSFAATDGEGYTHTNPLGAGNYLGVCDPDHPRHDDICNDKLIGAWSFYPGQPTARDWFGHGSHVGSTIAGNVHEATFTVGGEDITQTIQGVAPRANVISYQICLASCPESATIAAVDQAIADPTQVLNYSIEGTDNPWGDIVSLAFLDAFNAGIFVSASAGNSGPQAGTAAKTAPWNASVAAANHRRAFGHRLAVTGGPAFAAVPGSGPAVTADLTGSLREGGSGCTPYGEGALAGAIALLDDTECPYRIKVGNAAAAGATAAAVVTGADGPPTAMGGLESTTIPSVMVERAAGATLRDAAGSTVELSAAVEIWEDGAWAETVAWFSSRGPSRYELLAPTLAAPGVGVLAASAPDGDDPEQYLVASGTSMAAPHVAGAGALLLALHPDWTPAQVRSALAGTAHPLAGDPFDGGAGMVDVADASRVGLVLDETHANFVAANPGAGGDPKRLNVPAFVEHGCAASCTWVRTLTNVAGTEATYTAAAQAPSGIAVTVSPSEFTLEPGAEQTVRVTVDLDPTAYPAGEWAFASVGFATSATSHGQPVAPVSYPITVLAAEPDNITLTAGAYRSRIDYHAELTWSGATSEQVDIRRDGELLATVDNHGRFVDDLGRPSRGTTYTYQVCRLGSQSVCSDEAEVEIDPLARPAPHPRITTAELPSLHVLEGYQHTLLATGGSGKHRWEATGLPEGLVLDETTGVLRRDPAIPLSVPSGPAEVTVSVRDAERPGPVSTATLALDVVGIDQVAAGWGHTCAIDTEQAAYCWGRDATGQIGRGVVGGDGIHVPTPVPVLDSTGDAPLTGITQIDGGDGHTCALTTEGTVYCWGANFDGRLGDGDPSDPKPLPVAVRDSNGSGPLTGVVEIAVGWQFACAATTDGHLYCWGNNSSGKLGIGSTGGIEPLPVRVPDGTGEAPLTGVTSVAAASSHACAIAGGTPYCWGGNFQGQLGIGETSSGSPLPVTVAGGLSDVVRLAAGPNHTCAVAAGTAYCWGANWANQLGRGTDGGIEPAPAEVLDPEGAGPLPGVTSIAVGGNHTCALGADGAAYCWGSNSFGQTGNGVAGGPNPSLPVEVRDPTGEGAFPAATSLATGSEHSCAVSASVTYCWGANFNRQLGIGQTIDAYTAPLPVPTRPGPAR